MACNGPFNFGAYCNPKMDELLKEGRETGDLDKRTAIYRKVVDLYLSDMAQIILFNYTWIWGMSDRVEGFVPNRDGLIRVQGLKLKAQKNRARYSPLADLAELVSSPASRHRATRSEWLARLSYGGSPGMTLRSMTIHLLD